MINEAPSRKSNGVMTMLAFICSNHSSWILRRAFNPFLHRAFAVCAAIIASREWTVFNCLLTILPPSVAIFKMINFTFGHKCKPRLPYSLLPLLLTFTTRYFNRLLVGDGGLLRWILAGAGRNRLVNRRRRRRFDFDRTGRSGMRRQPQSIVGGGDPVRFEVPAEVAEYASLPVTGEEIRVVGA